jgi:predicted DNA-binding WGR domain protein
MSEPRYFEKNDGGVVRHWHIRREGIRCRVAWGQVGGRTQATTMTLDDEEHAERHLKKKISEKKRQGYVEVAPEAATVPARAEPAVAPDAKLLEVMREREEQRYAGAWEFYWKGYQPLTGYPGVYEEFNDYKTGPGSFRDYLVVSEDERRGLSFVVKEPGHDPAKVAAFLDFIRPRLELAFDGRSHHKVAMPTPIGRFGHVLFCGPSLCRGRYSGRHGMAIPIFDCEIGDEDSETFVEARLTGRHSIPTTTWDREPHPVTDLRFDLRSADEKGFAELHGTPSLREKTFKVYSREQLERVIRLLPAAEPGGWLEIRNYRREVLRLTQADLTPDTLAAVDRVMRGAVVPDGQR